MDNTEKLLRAFIKASGFDIEETKEVAIRSLKVGVEHIYNTDYKVTKRDFKNKPTLHKIIRQYEKEGMTASEMIGRIMLMEGISNEDL